MRSDELKVMSDEALAGIVASGGELIAHHSVLITFLIQLRLQSSERRGRLSKVRLLLERQPIMLCSLKRPMAHLVHSTKIEVRKGVGLVTRRQQGSLEPA